MELVALTDSENVALVDPKLFVTSTEYNPAFVVCAFVIENDEFVAPGIFVNVIVLPPKPH